MNPNLDIKVEFLNAIETIRRRKSRPNFNNISNFLERRCGFDEKQVKQYLERLIKSEDIIKVDYKGSASYRNADISRRVMSSESQMVVSSDVSGTLENLVQEAIANNKNNYGLEEETGASLSSIELQSMKYSVTTLLNRRNLKEALDQEVDYGNRIRRLSNGNYTTTNAKTPNCYLTSSNDENLSRSSTGSGLDINVVQSSPPNLQIPLVEPKQSQVEMADLKPKKIPTKRKKAKAKKNFQFSKAAVTRKWMIPHIFSQSKKPHLSEDYLKKRARPPSQRKRFKKYHGPDFLETSSLPSLDCIDEPDPIIVEEEIIKCDYCLMPASSNPSGVQEDLLICKDCNAKAHPTCMDYSPELARKSRLYAWQCMDCKICTVCEDAEDGECMLFCDSCDKGYHMSCHKPKIVEKPQGKWVCFQCFDAPHQPRVSGGLEKSENLTSCRSKALDQAQAKENAPNAVLSGLPTPCDSPASVESNDSDSKSLLSRGTSSNDVSKQIGYPQTVPDAKDWSMEDVYKFLFEIGFPEQAAIFRDQEIDGKSLLLMKRSDVLTGMSLRLGPALKIYNHIKRLQIGNPDGKVHINAYSF